MEKLDQLKKLVLEGGFDAESKRQVQVLEDRLHKAVIGENLKTNPVIKDYIEYLTVEIERCTYLLGHDDKLSDAERNKLFAKRDLANHFLNLFTGTQAIEEEINSLLDVATTT